MAKTINISPRWTFAVDMFFLFAQKKQQSGLVGMALEVRKLGPEAEEAMLGYLNAKLKAPAREEFAQKLISIAKTQDAENDKKEEKE